LLKGSGVIRNGIKSMYSSGHDESATLKARVSHQALLIKKAVGDLYVYGRSRPMDVH